MKQNVGTLEKIARVGLGGAVLSLAFFGPQTAWGYLGLIALLSGVSGFCPLYAAARKLRTRKTNTPTAIEQECWDREGRWGLEKSDSSRTGTR